MNSSILIDSLVRLVVSELPLSTRGIHGPSHWFGVRKNGLLLADMTGANNKAVELFALYHDCMRFNDGRDQEYGLRGAKKAYKHWKEGLMILLSGSYKKTSMIHNCIATNRGIK